jgi:hypothetical protein
MSQPEAPAAPRYPIIRHTPSVVTVEPSVPPSEVPGPPCPVVVERTPSLVIVESPHLPPIADMYAALMRPEGLLLPSWWDLPSEDGAMENAYDHAQSSLLKETSHPALDRRHPDGLYCVTHDTGIYFRTLESRRSTAVVPDWCYVPGLPKLIDGRPRPSFVMWRERVDVGILFEYVSENPGGEWDRTPETGKFWVYEHIVRPAYYVIYDVRAGTFEVYRHGGAGFARAEPNERGRYLIEPVGLELGVWTGAYEGTTLPWLRWFDPAGQLVPTGQERADQERQRTDQERQLKEAFAAKLRELGVDPDQL